MSPKQLTSCVASVVVAVATVIIFCCCIAPSHAQENAQGNIPPSLVECYNTSYFMNRDNRLPATINTLITLIEKVEYSNGFNMDMRELSSSLLFRFRQDGIQRAPGIVASPGVLPYSPTGFQFPKFRILLSRLISGNGIRFPNSSLTREERCSLHFMLSSSFDTQVRGDENKVCNQLAQYSAQRLPRSVQLKPQQQQDQQHSNFIGDVEILDSVKNSGGKNPIPQTGQEMRFNPNSNSFGDFDYWSGGSNYGSNDNSLSQCPVENGVIWTPWGTVTAGTLIAGIAAGLQVQQVQLRTLLSLARRQGFNAPQSATINVDNRWAATLAGDLAEVALVQVPTSSSESANVGANGAWNSTVMPKWYFLKQRQNLEMTDAEIRGGMDGLILGMNIMNWRNQASNMRLSQLLRMYYSMDGVLGSGIMACNRKNQFQNTISLNDMIVQTSAFAQVLDREMRLKVTLAPEAIAQFSSTAANALMVYIPQYLNDVPCSVSNAQSQDISQSITAMTDIYVYLDTSWQYSDIVNYLNYVLQRLNIFPYASSVTLLAAFDASIIVNTTNTLSDVYENWNVTTHSWYTPGFNLPTILSSVQNLTQTYMNGQKTNSSVGGRSLVALLLPNMAMMNDPDRTLSVQRLQNITERVPDLRFIYYGGGSISRFSAFVRNPQQDLFPLNIGADVVSASGPVVIRIKKIPRRIINPRCGASWYTSTWGNDQMAQYVSPGDINFYRVATNYFFGKGKNRYVSVQSQNSLSLSVCSSRYNALPMQNSTSSSSTNQSCVQVSSNSYTYDLSNACNGYSTIHQCPPLYLSVQAPQMNGGGGGSGSGSGSGSPFGPGSSYGSGSVQSASCNDNACQTPDQYKFTISVVNMGCFSGTKGLIGSVTLIAMAFVLRSLLL